MGGKLAWIATLAAGGLVAVWWLVPGAVRGPENGLALAHDARGAHLDGGLGSADEQNGELVADARAGEDDGWSQAEPPRPDGGRSPIADPDAPDAEAILARAAVEAVEEEEIFELGLGTEIPEAEPLTPERIAELIEDLRDDGVRYNADSAVWRLSQADANVLPALEAALLSADGQQRQLAAYVLSMREDTPATQVVADALVRQLGEHDPAFSRRRDADTGAVVPAWNYFRLRDCAQESLESDEVLFRLAEPRLVLALGAWDAEERLRAGCVLAKHHSWKGLDQNLGQLIECLRDNDVQDDAGRAMTALCNYGGMSAGALCAAWPGSDEQQRKLLEHLLARFAPDHPAASRMEPEQFTALGLPRGDPVIYSGVGWE